MRSASSIGAAALAMIVAGATAAAQTPSPPPSTPPSGERRAPMPETPAQPQVPPGPSDRGVIRPPNVDPDIQAPTVPEPRPNTTPVIPPPANPPVQPR